jgi:small subunit ribosomal protein S4
VNIPSYSVKHEYVIKALASAERDFVEYFNVDASKMRAEFVRIPALGDVPYPVIMEPNVVVEYYAKN